MSFLRFFLVPITCFLWLLIGWYFVYYTINLFLIVSHLNWLLMLMGGILLLIILRITIYRLLDLFTEKLMEFYKFNYLVAILHTVFRIIGLFIGLCQVNGLMPGIAILWQQSWIKTIFLIFFFKQIFLASIIGALEPIEFSKSNK